VVPPERLGKYELVRFLASGGMARIYLARVSGVGGFERHVVLKTVRPERVEDDAYLAMFLDEARLLATLHHQHVAQVYEVGVADDGTYFLAMEYVHGETLRSVLGRAKKTGTRVPLAFAMTAVCAAASGLHHAHDRRGTDGQPLHIVHRDVSPSNVIAGYDGSVKLIDFGIAKAAARSTVTQTGYVKGKAGYMSPEQALGYPVDRRTDVFALGIVLYELTTQQRAFRASTEHESVQRMVRGQVTAPSKIIPGYPPELEDIILTALEVDPDDRFGDVDGMQHAIELAAQHLGVRLAPHAIARTLGDLFGARPEPWLAGSPLSDEEDPSTATESGVHVAMAVEVGPAPVVRAVEPPKITVRGHTVPPPTPTAPMPAMAAPRGADSMRAVTAADAEDQPTHRFFTVDDPALAPPPADRARSVTAPQRPPSRRSPTPGGEAMTAAPSNARPASVPPPTPVVAAPLPALANPAKGSVPLPTMPIGALQRPSSPMLAAAFEPSREPRGQAVSRAVAVGTAPPPIGLPLVPPGATLPGIGARTSTLPGVAPVAAAPSAPMPIAAAPSAPMPITAAPSAPMPIAAPITAPIAAPITAPIAAPAFSPFTMVTLPTAPVAPMHLARPTPPRRRSPALIIGAFAAMAAGAAAVILLTSGGSGGAGAAAAASAPPPAAAAPAPSPHAPVAAPAASPGPRMVHVRVTSEPTGATVVLDGARLGPTPFDITVPARAEPATIKVRLGHVAHKKIISLDADVTWDVSFRVARVSD
jgi:serine/threonine-protein kinase